MNNLFQMAMQMRANPQRFLGNIQGVNMNDPNAIIQHLMNNGRVTQEQYNAVIQRLRQFGYKG